MSAHWGNSVSSPMFSREGEPLTQPLLRPLFEDVAEFDRLLSLEDSQFARRGYIRAGFALIEGQLQWFKNVVRSWLLMTFQQTGEINIATMSLLDENSYFASANGKIETNPQRMAFRNHCALVLRIASDLVDYDADSLFSDNGWLTLKRALEVRHRLTHPKIPSELNVSAEEIYDMREGHRWIFNCFVTIVNKAAQDNAAS